MRRKALWSLILILEVVLFLDMRAQNVFALKERDIHVEKLSDDIIQFIAKGKLSGDDEKIASEMMSSLFQDPPLKTVEEKILDRGRSEPLKVAIVNEEQQESLRKRVEAILRRHHRKNMPLPVITPDQLHDLDRLFKLNDVFRRNHLHSVAIGNLIELVFSEIEASISV